MSRRVIVLAGAAVVVAVAGVAVALGRGGGGGDGGVVLLAATAAGPDDVGEDLDLAPAGRTPGPPPGGEVDVVEQLDDAVSLAGRRVEGDAALLYAGTRRERDCDVDRLAELLTGDDADRSLAEAWFAAVNRHVDEPERNDYLEELTPVRLRFDTRVTGHGFRDGATTDYPAILQAGTAVLVDDSGVPRARCTGVTPLSEPAPAADVTGEAALDVDALAANPDEAWEGFDPAAVVVVVTEAGLAEGVDLADVAGGEAFTRPLGTDGLQDRQVVTAGGPDPADPCDERECPTLEITVQGRGGTAASLSWEGLGRPTEETPTSLRWDEAAPRDYRYDVHHEWVVYRVLGPDDPQDPTTYDDPAYPDEVIVLDTPAPDLGVAQPRMMECAPGDVTITVTVDGTVAESTTEPVSCTGIERTFTLG